MKRIAWAALVAAGVTFTVPARADDPKGEAEQAAKAGTGGDATSAVMVEEIRSGAGSMEPSDGETREEAAERAFVENVWNSP